MTPVEIIYEGARWDAAGLDALAQRAALATLSHMGLDAETTEISLLACDDARIADLNADFRGKPVPTNVLSWPAEELAPEEPGLRPDPPDPAPDGTLELGDIAIAYETCAREAVEQGKRFEDHVSHLLVHGILHLLGFDHIQDADATLMEAIEIEILGKMGVDDPYRG